MYQIEEGITPPTWAVRPGPKSEFADTLVALEVGQSFLVTDLPAHKVNSRIASSRVGPTKGRTFTTAKAEDGIRIWRIA